MDNTERHARIDMAALFRMAARLGWQEGVCNHFSMALDAERFLLNPQGLQFNEIRARDLLIMALDSRKLAGDGAAEPTAVSIHAAMHAALPRARCILHTHMPYATALTSLERGRLEMINQNSLRFFGRIAYDDGYNGLASEAEEGRRITAQIGEADILFMANHGIAVLGPDPATAFDDTYYLELACRVQVLAMSSGAPLKRVSDEVARKTRRDFAAEPQQAELHFASIKRLLDREEPDYAD